MSKNVDVTAKSAVVFNADTKEHSLNSAYALGKLIEELGTKDIVVGVYHKDNKKDCEEILNHFKIDNKNVMYFETKEFNSWTDKYLNLVHFCCRNKVPVIAMPNTLKDTYDDPQKTQELMSGSAMDKGNALIKEWIKKVQKPKDEETEDKLFLTHKVSPSFMYKYMDDQYIKDNRDNYGLKKFFPDPDEAKP
jgi:hypothetical protein